MSRMSRIIEILTPPTEEENLGIVTHIPSHGHLYSVRPTDIQEHHYALKDEENKPAKYLSRKTVENEVKRATAELAAAKEEYKKNKAKMAYCEVQGTITDGEWTVYLTPSARLDRGIECQHCLGVNTGKDGDKYIAVGISTDTYGYFIDRDGKVAFDQAYGVMNGPLKMGWRHGQAMAIANKYASQSVSQDSDSQIEVNQSANRVQQAEYSLRCARSKEIAHAVFVRQVKPPIMIEQLNGATHPISWFELIVRVHNAKNLNQILDIVDLPLIRLPTHEDVLKQWWWGGRYFQQRFDTLLRFEYAGTAEEIENFAKEIEHDLREFPCKVEYRYWDYDYLGHTPDYREAIRRGEIERE